jgi:phage-related protein
MLNQINRKQVWWMGDSRKRLQDFPGDVRWEVGGAIDNAELGDSHQSASTMKGINAVEIVSHYDGDTYRCVYTTKFKGHIYVLHAFKKKSKRGSRTPKPEVDLIKKRLKDAETHYKTIDQAEC